MKEELKELANRILNNDDILSAYKRLAVIFDENRLYHEKAAILEKTWHITKEHELYREIGDIFFYKLRNKEVSLNAYNRYLQLSLPDFYKGYAENLYQLGIQGFKYAVDNEDYSRKLVNLCDRYNTIIHIMICLFKNKHYNTIIEIKHYLDELKNQIDLEINLDSQEDLDTVHDASESNIHLSEILSEEEHHNDLNLFAIQLNPENRNAYLNIIGDYIAYKNYDEAIDFYNNKYAEKYNQLVTTDVSFICWLISDYYRDKFQFYKAVKYQKYALEIDSEKEIL